MVAIFFLERKCKNLKRLKIQFSKIKVKANDRMEAKIGLLVSSSGSC